jgi:hypothetical protein
MATTTNFGWETPDDTDLVKDGALAMRTLGNSIDTSFVDLKGGTTGQVLSKASNTDLDFTWVAQDDSNAIQNAIVDAKGDLISATAADTPARLAVGTNGQYLSADSSTATGLKWVSPSSGALTLTGSASPSASSNFTITNCFSATYRNYLVVFDGSETADTLIRFGTNGTANTTSNYTYRGYYNISSITALNTNQATSFKMLDHGTVTIGGTIRIQSPYESKRTCYQWDLIGVNGSTTALDANLAGFFDATTSFTDLNFSSSGTFTGNVYVYGLANS